MKNKKKIQNKVSICFKDATAARSQLTRLPCGRRIRTDRPRNRALTVLRTCRSLVRSPSLTLALSRRRTPIPNWK